MGDTRRAVRSAPSGPADRACVQAGDVKAMLRLGRELHAPGLDPPGRKRMLLAGICRLVGADRGLSVVAHLDADTGRRAVVSIVPVDVAAGAAQAAAAGDAAAGDAAAGDAAAANSSVADDFWHPAPDASALLDRAGIDSCIDSFVSLHDLRLVAWVVVGRRPGDGRPFTARHHLLLDLMHAESQWVYDPEVVLASAGVAALTPRQREVLQSLLAGDAEKQTAARLGCSPNTVHHHVKALYRHFGVSTRGELLARWVKGRG